MEHTLTKVVCGCVAIPRALCPKCSEYAFVVRGKFTCCDALYVDEATREKTYRLAEGEFRRSRLPLAVRQRILEQQGHKCIYCDESLLDTWIWDGRKSKYVKLEVEYDHFLSWNFSRETQESGMVAACRICNRIKSDKHFQTIEEARIYIMKCRIAKQIGEETKSAAQ